MNGLTPFWHMYLTVLSFVFGSCIGSFLNVCVYRIPEGKSVIHPPSNCPHCTHPIRWWQNIPLVSFLLLRGKCSNCQVAISPRYFLLELLTAVLFLLIWMEYGVQSHTWIYWIMVSGLILGTFVDFDHMIIPR